jgi:GTP pyrophosphokinase
MRIIAGAYRGRVLKTTTGPGFRPAMGKVREALFSMLEARGLHWPDVRVLDLFAGSVFCFTPKGDVKTLPRGATPIDFAYSIHSAVGNKMVGAKVNGNVENVEYVIQHGDQIEIITSNKSKGPSRDWLSIIKSTQARNKINEWFKHEFKEENIVRGKDLLERCCKNKGFLLKDLLKPEFMKACMKKYGFHVWDSVYAAVGHGGLKEGQVVNRLLEEYHKKNKKEITDEQVLEVIEGAKENKPPAVARTKGGIVVEGIHDVAVRFSKCCSPVPGDKIVGFVTRGRGVSIHRMDCVNVAYLSEEERVRLIEAEWNEQAAQKEQELYMAEIVVYADDKRGVLFDVSRIFSENLIDVKSMNVRTSKEGTATITVGFEIRGVKQLNYIVSKIRSLESVLDIERV